MSFHIVLVEPEIPANTGNIARTCAATDAHLHLVKPLGFSTDDRYLKRAGLDYWHAVKITYYDSFSEVLQQYPQSRFFCVETDANRSYTEFEYADGDFFVFGKESAGLNREILESHQDTWIRLPMTDQVRSLNLANSAAIILYEALRQTGFSGMN